jgi:hypothetical protein
MDGELGSRMLNTNPSRFEELAGVIATAYAYYEEGRGLEKLLEDFQHLYRRALDQPPCYSEINEITGQSLTSGDRMAGQTAWMLQKIESLRVYGVHSMLWHEVDKVYTAPLIDQIGIALGIPSRLTQEDLKHMAADRKALVDVVGVKGGETIWIVQSIGCKRIVDSAVARGTFGSTRLFKSRVFNDPVLDGQSLKSLTLASYFMRKAFPDVPVLTLCMVLHTSKPDFELYQVDVAGSDPTAVKLEEQMIRKNSIDYTDELRDNWEALLTLPQRLDNDLFQGLPPCRGGRTLGILASTAKRQLDSERLLVWKEQEVMNILKEDFGYMIPRDKVRHDLGDRLVGNGFMRKCGSEHSLTMKGVARYLYCLAKYTTKAKAEPEEVIEACKKQRSRILEHYNCT